MIDSNPAIETHGLCKVYGNKAAVKDLTLTVAPGEVFGFLGPNGAGKTTSVKMLLNLASPTFGEAKLFGVALDNLVGFLSSYTFVDQSQQDTLREDKSAGHVQVGEHAFGVDLESADDAGEDVEHVIEQCAGVRDDDALG